MTEWLRRPPSYALAIGVLMLGIGAFVGVLLVSFQDALYAVARREIIRRPEIHGFAGTEVIDQARIAEIADQANAALRLLHSHALGIGALIVLAAIAIANLPLSNRARTIVCALISAGAVYPLGYAVMAWLIPIAGVDALRRPIELIFFVPFGTAVVIGLVGATALSLLGSLRASQERQDPVRTSDDIRPAE
jgi:hypothetical protein